MKKVRVDHVLVSPAFGLVIDHFGAASIVPKRLRERRRPRSRILKMAFCPLEHGASPGQRPGFGAPLYSAEFQELSDYWRVKKHSRKLPAMLGDAAVGSTMQAIATFATLCGAMLSCKSLLKYVQVKTNCREHVSALLYSPVALARPKIATLPKRSARDMKQVGNQVLGVSPTLGLTIDQFGRDGELGIIEMTFCNIENKGAHPMGTRFVTHPLYAARLERAGGQWRAKENSPGLPDKLGGAAYATEIQAVAAFATLCGFLLSSRNMLAEPEHAEADERCLALAGVEFFGWNS